MPVVLAGGGGDLVLNQYFVEQGADQQVEGIVFTVFVKKAMKVWELTAVA